jgi:hypothetical protein
VVDGDDVSGHYLLYDNGQSKTPKVESGSRIYGYYGPL